MSRDFLKSGEYYEKYIKTQKDRIKKFEGALSKFGENDSAKIQQCSRILANFYKDLFTAEYSKGILKSELKKSFIDYVNAVKKSGVDNYAEMVDLLSIEILLRCCNDISWIEQYDMYNDSLIRALKAYIDGKDYGNSVSEHLKYPEYYKIFAEYLDEKVDGYKLLNYLSEKWYESSADMSWYESHLSKEDTYAGYWCWLAAALFKIKQDEFQVTKYFPGDLI